MKNIIHLPQNAYIVSSASVVGEEEFSGPLGKNFDIHSLDGDTFGCPTWEKSESEMQRLALKTALDKAKISKDNLDFIAAGDLINQCSASNYGLLSFNMPLLGIYGACSTAAEGLLLTSVMCSTGTAQMAAAVTSSHNATAERQFRFPLEYGAQRTPTSQWTVTGAGAFVISREKVPNCPMITHAVIGRPQDSGLSDANNMGAVMAPAAADTFARWVSDGGEMPELLLTGDLGAEGLSIFIELLKSRGIKPDCEINDCGVMIFDRSQQDKHAGGSGCGCSAAVLSSVILKDIFTKKIKDVLFIGTGALLSSMSVQQGQTIPSIAHLVRITTEER